MFGLLDQRFHHRNGYRLHLYQTSQPNSSVWNTVAIDFGLPYFSVSIGLNIRTAMGAPSGTTGLYKAIIAMLIESSAFYAVSSLLFIGTWGAGSHAADIFLGILKFVAFSIHTPPRSPKMVVRYNDRSSLHCSSFDESPPTIGH